MAINNMVKSRSEAQDLIKRSLVSVDSKIVTKANTLVSSNNKIEIIKKNSFVSRAGEKLDYAISKWNINLSDLIVLDIGSSTGGFTDCALQHNAKQVFAVDVGTNQLDKKLRNDNRVIVMEKNDIRKIKELNPKPDIAVIDVSFISLTLILKDAKRLIKEDGMIIALIKPQFEVGKEIASLNKGIIKEEKHRQTAIEKVLKYLKEIGLELKEIIESPIQGSDGNIEYLTHIQKRTNI